MPYLYTRKARNDLQLIREVFKINIVGAILESLLQNREKIKSNLVFSETESLKPGQQ